MADQRETQLLATMFDRLYDIVTYAPDNGKVGAFDKKTTFVQLAKAMPIDPDDYKDACSPANPKGSLTRAQNFSKLWDAIPKISTVYTPGGSIEEAYSIAIQGDVKNIPEDEKTKQLIQKATDYLITTTKITDFDNNVQEVIGYTPRYQNYFDTRLAYTTALVAYRNAYNSYDMDNKDDQRKWAANAPLLQANIDMTFRKWTSSGATQIEQAENVLTTHGNNVVSSVLAEAKKQFDTSKLPSNLPDGSTWHLSYALPSNWYAEGAANNFTAITISSEKLSKTVSDSFTSYGGGASFASGLFSFGGGGQGSSEEHHEHMVADKFTLKAKIGTVQIIRPWFRSALFGLQGWFLEEQPAGYLTPGTLDKATEKTLLPLLPVGFVVARDIEITANWSTSELNTLKKSFSANVSVGWGPFSLSGHYSKSTADSQFKSELVGNTIKVPGIQVIAVINSILPFAPPLGPHGEVPTTLRFLFDAVDDVGAVADEEDLETRVGNLETRVADLELKLQRKMKRT